MPLSTMRLRMEQEQGAQHEWSRTFFSLLGIRRSERLVIRGSLGNKGLQDPGERNGFVDQHDGNITANRVEVSLIRANEPAFDLLDNRFPAPIFDFVLFDLLIDLFDQRRNGNRQV